jgi:putative DNA-invertase from lambdoid prophage Rac
MIDLGGDVTGDGIARLVFTILSAVAEAESDRIKGRVAIVNADQKTRNRFLGGDAPFGFPIEAEYDAAGKRKGGRLVEDADQQRAIAEMRVMHQIGKSLRTIAAAMQARGYKISQVGVKQVINRMQNKSA